MPRLLFGLTLFLLASTLPAAGAALPVPPNLHVEDVPPLPVSLMERLASYNEYRTATLQDWHPSRREMLILTRFGQVPQVHRVATPGGARTQVTFFQERIGAALYRPKGNGEFLYSRDTGGSEFYQLYLFDPATGQSTLLTDGQSRNTSPVWSDDGRWLAYASTRRNGRDSDIWVTDPSRPAETRMLLQVDGGGWAPVDWSPDGGSLLVEHFQSINESALYLVNAKTGERRLVTSRDQPASYWAADFAQDGKGVYVSTDRDAEFKRLARIELASGRLTVLRPDLNWDVTTVATSADGRRLAYIVNEDGADTLHVMDTASQKDLRLPRLPPGTISEIRWHAQSGELALSMSSARSPSDVYSIDVEKGTLERWTRSETGGLNAEEFSEPELVRWKSFDGRMISGFLYLPPAKFSGRRPVILNIHGGPEGQYQPGFLGRNNYLLNELGVAVLYPNVRGSLGYGKTFQNLDNAEKREDSVKDIGALLDWIAGNSRLNAGRVMVMGGSYGGYMTLASMTHYNDRLRCGLDYVGISNFVTFLERTESYRRDLRRVEYGDESDPKMRDFLLSISPRTHAARITKPMFIVQGKNDPRVPAFESEEMVKAIRSNGGPVWYLLAEDEGHGFSKKPNQDYFFAAMVLFIQQHLLGG